MSQARSTVDHFLQNLRGQMPLFAVRLRRIPSIIRLWRARSAQRHALSQLEPHRLKDIGLTKEDVERECRKAFWQ
jgi:uncharacterized protein YjiS (DUF1127 family)